VLIILSQAIRIVREYERVVIFQLGRFSGVMISAEMIRVAAEHMEKNG
jgi:regulator of protease activity HflC (stomatin/prohibitin superfamily)